jgi:hypothetical protein
MRTIIPRAFIPHFKFFASMVDGIFPKGTLPMSAHLKLPLQIGRAGLATGLLFALEGGVLAQSTMCMRMGPDMISCHGNGETGPRHDTGQSDEGNAILGRAIGNLIAGNPEKRFRKKLGRLLADGDCRGAARLAFEDGRIELGAQISQTCQ